MAHEEPYPSFRKLDFVTDASNYISMLIYNTHPADSLLIAPKYYPDPNGIWKSQVSGQKYSRFEYYWNLKQKGSDDDDNIRVYEVDKNPLHEYATDVVNRFNQHLGIDPCHKVLMYRLPRAKVGRYWDAKQKFAEISKQQPSYFSKFAPFLKKMEDLFDPKQVGITGSYLYDLYQDFSDLNFVVYDDGAGTLHDMLLSENALLNRQDIEVNFPNPSWPGWISDNRDGFDLLPANTKQKAGKTIIPIKNRFIGSIHDPINERTRAGFWLSNTVDPYPYGTFSKTPLGIGIVTGTIKDWTHDLASGHLRVENVDLLGFHPNVDITLSTPPNSQEQDILDNLTRKINISAIQIIGEFNRMFLTHEDIVAFGLVEEIVVKNKSKPVYELLVGGREVGGWILPRN